MIEGHEFSLEVVDGKLSVTNASAIDNVVDNKVANLKVLAVAPDTYRSLETLRTENNKYIKEEKAIIEKAKEKYLEPFEKLVAPVESKLAELETANEDFAKKILDAKKIAFKEDMRIEYARMAIANPDGELPDFDKEVWENGWYTLSKARCKDCLAAKLNKINLYSDATKMSVYCTLHCTKYELDILKKFLTDNHIPNEIVSFGKE